MQSSFLYLFRLSLETQETLLNRSKEMFKFFVMFKLVLAIKRGKVTKNWIEKSQKNLHRPTLSSVENEKQYVSPSDHRSNNSNRNVTVNLARHSVSPRPQTSVRSPKATRESSMIRFEEVKPRRSGKRTEAEISVAKNKQQRANAKKRNERIKNYDASRRNIR